MGGLSQSNRADCLTTGGVFELILREYKLDAVYVLNNWWYSYLELMLEKRNERVRRENGEEESVSKQHATKGWNFADFENAAAMRRKANANRNKPRRA